MFGLSPIQLLICGGVAVLLFGGRLPSVARSLGKSLTELRRGMQDMQHEFRDAMREVDDAAQSVTDVTRGRLPGSAAVAHDDSAPDSTYDTYEVPDESSDADDETAEAEAPADPDPDADRKEGVDPSAKTIEG